MRSRRYIKLSLWTLLGVLTLVPLSLRAAGPGERRGDESRGALLVQRETPEEVPNWGNRLRGWWRRSSEYQKNHASIKAAYRPATSRAGGATAQVLAGGQSVALATVVDPDGFLVTKASLLGGDLVCRFGPGDERPATLVGVSQDHDLALLKVEGKALQAIAWRSEPAPPGTLVAAVDPDGEALGIGVVSGEARDVPGSRRAPRDGYLGVSLDDSPTGVLITQVSPESAAAAAGIQAGDVVRSIGGVAMRSTDQMIDTVGSHAAGETLRIVLRRQAEQFTVSAVLGKRPPGLARDLTPEDHWGGGPFSERRKGFPRVVPHDTIVPPNQCGGPLVDTDGKAVGINIARALRVTTYALPPDIVQQVVAQLKPALAVPSP
ncbi:MAG: PDZ domain-containing protein [Pirellulaceae bacterium]|nr:PDZ domain-containing protein [Pirellulaceae bacterium]